MKRAEWLQETRKMRFKEAHGNYKSEYITQKNAAKLPGVCDHTFQRYMNNEGRLDALLDNRLTQTSHRCAPVDEVMRLTEQYCKDGGMRSYTWGKSRLQEAGLMIHQDGGTHEMGSPSAMEPDRHHGRCHQ